jgi:hypothetical protein
MHTIQRYRDFSKYDDMLSTFLKAIEPAINESDNDSDNMSNFKRIQKKVLADLRLNLKFVGTFGAGIAAFYPIVESLMLNWGKNIEITPEVVVLATLCAFTIIYIEERKFKNEQEETQLTEDSKSMLEELKMKGVGNGIIKKLAKCFRSISGLFEIISKHIGSVIIGFIDMFAYTSLLIPITNGILSVVNKYNLNLETLADNLVGLTMGIGTIVAKHTIMNIFNRLRDKIDPKKINPIELTNIKKVAEFGDPSDGSTLINENE